MLHLVILSAVYYHATEQWTAEMRADPANAVLGIGVVVPVTRGLLAYLAMFTWFIVEYLYYEDVHTFTYDVFRERLGLKLIFGCFCFYPFFYPIGVCVLTVDR